MGPPLYGDLGKQARDIFSKGYHFDLIKLDIKTKTPTGVEFATGGTSQIESGKVFGTIESKYKFKDYGKAFSTFMKIMSFKLFLRTIDKGLLTMYYFREYPKFLVKKRQVCIDLQYPYS